MLGPTSLIHDDTIAAIASAPGGAARGIVRVSGPGAGRCVAPCFRPAAGPDWRGALAACTSEGQLLLPMPLGCVPATLYWWPGPASYTRQPTAELHTWGAPPILDATLDALRAAGARLARPGEFTLRAFLAGRLDLTQAEAVLGVIDARGQVELDVALRQLAGGLAQPLQRLRDQLLDALAHLEAGLDFVEDDIEFISHAELGDTLSVATDELESLTTRMSTRGESVVEPRVVLRGSPNVGKSSLLNALAGRQAALVADGPGTTRDYVARWVRVVDRTCLLIDTAGVERESPSDSIAGTAQALSAEQHAQAELELFCVDSTRPLDAWEESQLLENSPSRLVVLTKLDRAAGPIPAAILGQPLNGRNDQRELLCERLTTAVSTSSHTGRGLDELCRAIVGRLSARASDEAGVVAGTAARCRESVERARQSLRRARELVAGRGGEELIAVELRLALEELGQVVGAVYTDDLLDRIFSRFCIGK